MLNFIAIFKTSGFITLISCAHTQSLQRSKMFRVGKTALTFAICIDFCISVIQDCSELQG